MYGTEDNQIFEIDEKNKIKLSLSKMYQILVFALKFKGVFYAGLFGNKKVKNSLEAKYFQYWVFSYFLYEYLKKQRFSTVKANTDNQIYLWIPRLIIEIFNFWTI